jgi:predicted lipoprotein with Yx(FWY)xxD motif
MPRSRKLPNPSLRTIGALAALSLLIAIGATQVLAAKSSKHVAGEAENPALGKTVLTTTKGRTLYSLSVEKNGKFICTASCLSVWHPLMVAAGVRPTGPVRLATVRRPEGGTQVTYKGRPLYRFGGDAKAGQTNGEGIKDVGTWHAASPPQKAAEPTPQPQPEDPYPYGNGY